MASVPGTFQKRHLWMYLQALGLDPARAATIGGKILSRVHLGVNMFDKPNRDAFHIVSYFLFQTLDESLAKEVFKDCWPPFDQKRDAEFRKHCCEWLKEISAECGSTFPQVVGSQFLSPGGPKVIHLMYHFARFVAIKYFKTKSKNSSLHFAETFNIKPRDMHSCIARCHVARNRFFQILQREHYVTQKYQENAQLLVKQLRNLRSRHMELQNQIKKVEPCDDQINIQEKIQKVQSLWTSMNETLMFLEKGREVVSSVLSLVDQCALDGTNVVVNVPRLLLEKIEKQICQLQIGNVYETGKLNLLTVIQLLNEVLKVMKYEHCEADQPRLTIDLHYLEKEVKLQRERLSHMKHMRHKIKENVTVMRDSVTEKQEEWHRKWKEFLGLSPFSLIKGWTSAVGLLPPMSPLSFDPVSEEVYEKSILSKYPASLPDTHKEHNQENGCRSGDLSDLATSPASFLLQYSSSSGRNSVLLLEKDTNMRTPKEKNVTTNETIQEFKEEDSPLSDIAKNTENYIFRESLPAKKSDLYQKEQEHLVEEVARVVLSDSPQLSEGKEVKLEELIDTLISNPFLTRKQIPRTPENLNFDKSFLPEEKVVSDHFKGVPQKNLVTSHIGEPPIEDGSDLLKTMCKQDSESTATKLSDTTEIDTFSPAVGSRLAVMGPSEAYISEPSMQKTLLWDSFQLSSGIGSSSLNEMDFGILNETLPEEVGHLSLSSPIGSETNFKPEPNSFVPSGIFPDDTGKRQTTPESDFSLQAIRSSYEALKKSLSKIRKESCQFAPETLEQQKIELSAVTQNMQASDARLSDTCDLLIDDSKPSSHMSLAKRKQPLLPLTKSSLVEQKLRTMVPCSLGELLPDLKEEISNKSLGTKESLT